MGNRSPLNRYPNIRVQQKPNGNLWFIFFSWASRINSLQKLEFLHTFLIIIPRILNKNSIIINSHLPSSPIFHPQNPPPFPPLPLLEEKTKSKNPPPSIFFILSHSLLLFPPKTSNLSFPLRVSKKTPNFVFYKSLTLTVLNI